MVHWFSANQSYSATYLHQGDEVVQKTVFKEANHQVKETTSNVRMYPRENVLPGKFEPITLPFLVMVNLMYLNSLTRVKRTCCDIHEQIAQMMKFHPALVRQP